MLLKIFFFIVIFLELLFGNTLNKDYYVNSNDINLSQIIPHVNSDAVLFSFEQGKYTKRVKSKDLIKDLKSYGYGTYTSKSNYIKFTKKSPIDTSKIKKYIKDFYKKIYPSIDIKQIFIMPRTYIESLPHEYLINIQKKNSLYNHGTLYIKTKQQKKIFFDYTIDANVDVYVAKNNIKRDTELSAINCVKKSIILDKFRATPLQNLKNNAVQTKISIRHGNIITLRDIRKLSVVKRGSFVTTILNSDGMSLSFSAKAETEGMLGDIITVQKSDGKKIKVRVTGRNMAEVQ
jgi:flagellar basal body P-ring formation protein FlgA